MRLVLVSGALLMLVAVDVLAAEATVQRAFVGSDNAARYETALQRAGVSYQVSSDDKGARVFTIDRAALDAKRSDRALVEFETWFHEQRARK